MSSTIRVRRPCSSDRVEKSFEHGGAGSLLVGGEFHKSLQFLGSARAPRTGRGLIRPRDASGRAHPEQRAYRPTPAIADTDRNHRHTGFGRDQCGHLVNLHDAWCVRHPPLRVQGDGSSTRQQTHDFLDRGGIVHIRHEVGDEVKRQAKPYRSQLFPRQDDRRIATAGTAIAAGYRIAPGGWQRIAWARPTCRTAHRPVLEIVRVHRRAESTSSCSHFSRFSLAYAAFMSRADAKEFEE